jgi:predicted RNA binding protein with dsRBD fold (UPF0201 family)
MRRHERPEPATARDVDAKRADDAITNLSAFALKLDFEYHQIDDRLLELVREGAGAADELRVLLRERDELGAARDAFRRSVTALHDLSRREIHPALSDHV